jgi:nitrogen regulatory protein P-II 1
MYMIMLVLDDTDRLDAVLEAWEKAGIRGATVIESTGIHRVRRRLIPMRYAFQTPGDINVETGNTTLFVIVESEAAARSCLQATEQVTGDLDGPNTGVFAAWPLSIVKGLPEQAEAK